MIRCLTLADELRAFGVNSVFLSRDNLGNLHQMVLGRRYPLFSLGRVNETPISPSYNTYADWLGVEPDCDSNETVNQISPLDIDWLIVDHYALDWVWEQKVRPACGGIIAIDDLANRKHSVDALLDQNLGRTKTDYDCLVPRSCDLMVGPRYALVRPEFAALREKSLSRRRQAQLHKILITMGGVDRENITSLTLEALNQYNHSVNFEVTVIMGLTAPWRDQVTKQAAKLPFPTRVLVNVQNMAELMSESDLAIGAAGSTAWERCCLGLPTAQLVIADNQRTIANALCEVGAAHSLELQKLGCSLSLFLNDLIRDPEHLVRMSGVAAKLVDGLGASRVARYISKRL